MKKKCWTQWRYSFLCVLFLMGALPAMADFSLKEGETYTCRISGTGIQPTTIRWEISNTAVLKFTGSTIWSLSAEVKAQSGAAGRTATVTCYYTYEPAYKVTINTSQSWTFTIEESGPQRIRVSPSSMTMDVGDSPRRLTAEVSPSTATSTVRWSVTSGYDVVSVSSAGYVTAKKPGDATVTATSTVNGVSGSCSVHVNSVDPTGIDISPYTRQQLAINSRQTFSYTLRPSYATTSVTWSLEGDKDAATLSSSGVLTGTAEGTVRVRVTTSNGYSDYCDVDVYKPVPSSISFAASDREITMPVGANRTISYTVQPSNAIYTVTWSSDASQVASVSQSGYIEAKSPGTAHITVTTDNGKVATSTVTVPPQPVSVAVTPKEMELLMGRTKQLSYAFTPTDAMARTVTWASSDYTIASVSQSGLVEARRPGTVKITATTDNGKIGTCLLTVPMPLFQLFVWMKNGEKTGYLSTDKPQFHLDGEVVKFSTDHLSLDISKDDLDKFTLEQVLPEHPINIALEPELKVGLGRRTRITYTLTPADAQTQVTWLNGNPDVVSVTDGGWVTGLQVGTSTLKAQTSNGLRAECLVTVPEPRYRFYVWLRDGGLEDYPIEEQPLVTMGDEIFTLTTSTTTVGYAAKDVLKFTLEDAAVYDPVVGIDQPQARQVEAMTFHTNEFTLAGARVGTLVSVYDVQGRLVASFRVQSDGTLSIPLHAYLQGIYIIKTEKSSYKIMKK